MTTEEIVARAAWESYRKQWSRQAVVPIPDWEHAMQETRDVELTKARAVVAALTEAGRLVPEAVREFVGEPSESFDEARHRMEQSARSWSECVTDISKRGDGAWVFRITAPALIPDGFVVVPATEEPTP